MQAMTTTRHEEQQGKGQHGVAARREEGYPRAAHTLLQRRRNEAEQTAVVATLADSLGRQVSITELSPVQITCILAIWGVVISAVYMLRAYRNVFHGPTVKATTNAADLTIADRIPALLLILSLLAVGLYPNLLLNLLR